MGYLIAGLALMIVAAASMRVYFSARTDHWSPVASGILAAGCTITFIFAGLTGFLSAIIGLVILSGVPAPGC